MLTAWWRTRGALARQDVGVPAAFWSPVGGRGHPLDGQAAVVASGVPLRRRAPRMLGRWGACPRGTGHSCGGQGERCIWGQESVPPE
eukprot:9143098-Pyramimonas_sp.AAC.1